MDISKLGKTIRQRRRWLNLSQADLAKQANVTIGLIRRLEFGRTTDVHLKKLERILTALDIAYEEFTLLNIPTTWLK